MPGKYTDGYTKQGQKTKFIRHRDVKMKDSELKREEHIKKRMAEGICRRCREKVQWRFRYDKYKPLKNVASCQQCKQKTVTKAYRTLCDKCATTRNVCPGCCGPMVDETGDNEAPSDEADAALASEMATEDSELSQPAVGVPTAPVEAAIEEADGEEDDVDEEAESIGDAGDVTASQMDEEELNRDVGDAPHWHENKFLNVAASKYSKARKTGTEEDRTFY